MLRSLLHLNNYHHSMGSTRGSNPAFFNFRSRSNSPTRSDSAKAHTRLNIPKMRMTSGIRLGILLCLLVTTQALFGVTLVERAREATRELELVQPDKTEHASIPRAERHRIRQEKLARISAAVKVKYRALFVDAIAAIDAIPNQTDTDKYMVNRLKAIISGDPVTVYDLSHLRMELESVEVRTK